VQDPHGSSSLDRIDLGLLGRLARDGRTTWKDLGGEFSLTAPAIATRVRRLVERGFIRQFAAWIDPEPLGAVTAFVDVTFEDAEGHEGFRQAVGRLVAVQECHRVAGDAHYVLKMRARSSAELEHLLAAILPKVAPGASWRVSLVLSTVKESPVFPLPRPTE
jgi:Lrp/AsnC family leucine-responsive transcriptional regulator